LTNFGHLRDGRDLLPPDDFADLQEADAVGLVGKDNREYRPASPAMAVA